MKGITCCGDCGYYNWKKHRCTRAKEEGAAQDHFYADCPLPDVAPVVHAKWIPHKTPSGRETVFERCSMCNHATVVTRRSPFCPNCGAKMDGEEW